jgi:hypothetical protein
MKETVVIRFGAHDCPWAVIREVFLHAGRADWAKAGPRPFGVYSLKVSPRDAEALRAALTERGLSWDERTERRYSLRELQQASLLRVVLRRAERGFAGPTYGTTYDLSQACPRCGTGAVQTSPLYLKKSEIPKAGERFQTLDHDHLVSESLADSLRIVGGLEIRQARDAQTDEPIRWFQLLACEQMPRMDERTRRRARTTMPGMSA